MARLAPTHEPLHGRRLLARRLIFAPTQRPFVIAWSLWRRRHQAAASIGRYRRRINSRLQDWIAGIPPSTGRIAPFKQAPALRTPRRRDARKTRSQPVRYGFGRMRLPPIGIRRPGVTHAPLAAWRRPM